MHCRWICTNVLAVLLASTPACSSNVDDIPSEAVSDSASAAESSADGFDHSHSSWSRVLQKTVSPGTINGVDLAVVDYAAVAEGLPEYELYLRQLAEVNLSSLSREQKLALWINAYNVLAIKMVADHLPLESIRDVGGKVIGQVWDKPAGTVAGKTLSLNQIEHEILRKMGEPRIHAAIVCASVSCPDLRSEAFVAERLDAQLDEQVTSWLANQGKGLRLDPENKTVRVSAIFDWFGEDFEQSDGSVLKFIVRFAPNKPAEFIRANREELAIEFLEYDWNLNSKRSDGQPE